MPQKKNKQTKREPYTAAVERLNELYEKSIEANDVRTALAAQRELDKLQGLYDSTLDQSIPACDECDYAKRIELIAQHILPLKLVAETYPVEEHVRVAAGIARKAKKGDAVGSSV